MSNKTSNTPNGVGDKKEVRVERNVPNELIDEHIKNWAAQKDKNGNIIPGTDDITIKVVFGDPYFKDNIANKDQKAEGNGSGNDTTVMENQGSKDLESVTNGLFIQTRPAPTLEQSTENDKKKSTKGTEERDDDTSRE